MVVIPITGAGIWLFTLLIPGVANIFLKFVAAIFFGYLVLASVGGFIIGYNSKKKEAQK